MRDCNHCGTMYARRRDAAKNGRGLYCSIKCSNEGRFGPMTVDTASVGSMYCDRQMTLEEIAAQLGTNWKRVRRVLVKDGATIRGKSRRRNPNRRSAATYTKIAKPQKGEVVHHLNGNELDDRAENLVAVSRRRHMQLHKQLERISAKLFMAGLISFDLRNGYEIMPKLSELM
jgi:HNH endonuclease